MGQKKETFRFFELRREWSMLKDEQKTEKLAEIAEEFKKFVDEKNEEKIITQFIESVRIGQSIDEISKIISQNSETSTICLLTKTRDAITKNEGTVPSCISTRIEELEKSQKEKKKSEENKENETKNENDEKRKSQSKQRKS